MFDSHQPPKRKTENKTPHLSQEMSGYELQKERKRENIKRANIGRIFGINKKAHVSTGHSNCYLLDSSELNTEIRFLLKGKLKNYPGEFFWRSNSNPPLPPQPALDLLPPWLWKKGKVK